MNEYCESSGKQRHVVPILVTLTEEEWLEVKRFYPIGVLYFQCTRGTMEDESELDHDSHFGDFIRWLFKLAPSDKDIPIEVIFKRKDC